MLKTFGVRKPRKESNGPGQIRTSYPTTSQSPTSPETTSKPTHSFKLKCKSKRKLSSEPKNVRWLWTERHVLSLLRILKDYKTFCDSQGIDFDADRRQLYENIRVEMAKIYPLEDFGPEEIDNQDPLMKSFATRGKIRVKDKILKIRATYRNSIKENRIAEDAGKVVIDNWDTLVFLWDCSPSFTRLPFKPKMEDEDDDVSETGSGMDGSDEAAFVVEEEHVGEEIQAAKKLKIFTVIDNSQTTLPEDRTEDRTEEQTEEQTDHMYQNTARDEHNIEKKMMENMIESSNRIASSIDKMSVAMKDVGKAIERGLGMIALAMERMHNPQPMVPTSFCNKSSEDVNND